MAYANEREPGPGAGRATPGRHEPERANGAWGRRGSKGQSSGQQTPPTAAKGKTGIVSQQHGDPLHAPRIECKIPTIIHPGQGR